MKFLIFTFIFNFSLYAKEPTFIMGALGDSISTAFNSYHLLSQRSGSWSTGDQKQGDFESHKMKIEKLIQKPVKAYNVAIPGMRSKNLRKQVKRLLKAAPSPDYVTILMGANDVCSWKNDYQEDLKKYKDNVQFAVEQIVHANPKAKILLVPVPKLKRLWDLGKNKKKCLKVWNVIPLCDPLFGKKLTEKQRETFEDRVVDVNLKLKEISAQFPENAFFYEVIQDLDFDEEHISEIDCFHPSPLGQKLLSEYTFNRDLFTEWEPK